MLQATDAETAVIGSMIRDNSLVQEIAAVVDERDFFTHFGRKAFAACVAMTGSFDDVILATAMGKGYVDSIVNAVDSVTSTVAAIEHAKRVSNAAILRRFIDACTEAIADAKDMDTVNVDDVLELVTRHQTAILNSSARSDKSSDIVSGSEGMKSVMKLVEARRESFKNKETKVLGFATGLSQIDHLIGGLQRKAMVVIGAQTGVGKSAMAVNMAAGALRDSASVLVLSHEMSTDDVYTRLLGLTSKVEAFKFQTGALDHTQYEKIILATDKIGKQSIWVTDNPPRTIPKTINTCLQHKRRHGLDIVFVDYLQLMESTQRSGNREQAVAEIARGLKQLAMDLDVCVVALAQLNNNTERHEEPQLSSLRESAAIAQNANSVILLWSKDDDAKEISFKVAKNRSGPHGQGSMDFLKTYQIIRESHGHQM